MASSSGSNNNSGGHDGSNSNHRRPWEIGRPHCRTCGKTHGGTCWYARDGQSGQVYSSVGQRFGAQGNAASQTAAILGAAIAAATAAGSHITVNNGPMKYTVNTGAQSHTDAAGRVQKPGKHSRANFPHRERRRESHLRQNIFYGKAETIVDPEEMLSYGTPGQQTEDRAKLTNAENDSHVELVSDFLKQAEGEVTAEGTGFQPMDTDQDTAVATTPTIDMAPVKAQLTDEQEMWAFWLRTKHTGSKPKDAPWTRDEDKILCTWFIDRMVIVLGNPFSSNAYVGLKKAAEGSGRPLVREAMISSDDLRKMYATEHTGEGAAKFLKDVEGAFPMKK